MADDARTRWGLPDWESTKDYPDPGESMQLWGWEFLRRRDDYRAIWTACEERAEAPSPGAVRTAMADDYAAMRRDYGMSRVIDATARLPAWLLHQLMWLGPYGYEVAYRSMESADADAADHKHAIMFDLKLPLAPQLQAARACLEFMQRELGDTPSSPKPRPEIWPLYLRVLDARDCGATFAKIAATLWPDLDKNAQSARDLHVAAQAVQRRAPFFL